MVTGAVAVNAARAGNAEMTEWISVAAFGRISDELARCRKGDLVALMGTLHRSSFTGRDGQARSSWSLTVESVISARTVRPRGSRRAVRVAARSARPQAGRTSGLPDDRIDDLYADGLAP
jgi:single-strand DNA-binding protein